MSSRGSVRAAWAALAVAAIALPAAGALRVDPTRPPELSSLELAPLAPEDAGGLRLMSILVSPERRLAVINEQSVRVGDRVADVEVLEIEPYAVRLRGPDGAFTLRLSGEGVKRWPGEKR